MTLATLDERDLPWVGELIEVVARAEGEPWRVALDQLERTPAPPNQLAAVTSALRRMLGGRATHARVARQVRGLVLGAPALDLAARDARLDAAARSLGIPAHELEPLLWSDLPRERAIALPQGCPLAIEIAAQANVHLLARALGRAHAVDVRLWGDDGSLLRAALARGLLATATRDGDCTSIAIVGPLAVCHRTGVYGRALAQVAPQLAACDRFELDIDAGDYTIAVASPVLLPIAPVDPAVGYLARKLARGLERADPSLDVAIAPAPLAAGSALLCPDLRAGDSYVELVGFWTAEHLATKLARYAEARADVIICVDQSRAVGDDDGLPPGVLGFTKRVDPLAVAALLRSRSCRSRDA